MMYQGNLIQETNLWVGGGERSELGLTKGQGKTNERKK